MTDHKSWLWRKKSSEKTISEAEKLELASRENEIHVLLAEKAELERGFKDLEGKLSSALAECRAKDNLVQKHSKTAKDNLAGWEKAEAKAVSLKEELDEAVKERDISEERTRHLDSALKECMQQLRFVREEKEQRINDVLRKASEELEETKMFLEEKLEQSDKMIAKMTAENSQLCKAILLKDQLIEELNQEKAKVEADVSALLARLEQSEKENNSLRYEVRVLEKEVDIRNEEKEFNRRTSDANHKQHLENVKKIAKLESECQRLRVLVRKRLPGPAALAKMKSEVDMLGRDSLDIRRKKSNLSTVSSMRLDYGVDGYPDSPDKKLNILTEKIYTLEEEKSYMQENLEKKTSELQILSNMYIQTAAKLSQLEAQLEESHKTELNTCNAKSSLVSHDLSLASISDVGSDDKVSCTSSRASKCVGMSDMNHLMDDFAEMEKLALVCIDKPVENSSITNNENIGKELVPIASQADVNMASKWSNSISKLIEIVRGINIPSEDHDATRVFQWKTSELTSILQNFLHICDDLLNEKSDIDTFTRELTCVLEWLLNRCFPLQDVSSMKNMIKRQSLLTDGCDSEISECEFLKNRLQELENAMASLQVEMEALKHSKENVEELFEVLMMMNEDLNTQLLVVNSSMDEAHKKMASLQAEVDCKVKDCDALETNCLNLQAELERSRKVNIVEHPSEDEKHLRTFVGMGDIGSFREVGRVPRIDLKFGKATAGINIITRCCVVRQIYVHT
ncbi:filament-like plant protein 7 isoform X2 [Amaranthus tricolor]|uniref:filament-like plant protein 7 isoform X2 n=1 Tax=Amaranthus tricolor TaxID=29722 RepID=UPI00258A5857|nr:filament-like plant protein 7 isoform X2 [Amaranthus tricolor]